MEKKTSFQIEFRNPMLEDWSVRLFTTEPRSTKEIQRIVERYEEINQTGWPGDILDNVVDAHPGWVWDFLFNVEVS